MRAIFLSLILTIAVVESETWYPLGTNVTINITEPSYMQIIYHGIVPSSGIETVRPFRSFKCEFNINGESETTSFIFVGDQGTESLNADNKGRDVVTLEHDGAMYGVDHIFVISGYPANEHRPSKFTKGYYTKYGSKSIRHKQMTFTMFPDDEYSGPYNIEDTYIETSIADQVVNITFGYCNFLNDRDISDEEYQPAFRYVQMKKIQNSSVSIVAFIVIGSIFVCIVVMHKIQHKFRNRRTSVANHTDDNIIHQPHHVAPMPAPVPALVANPMVAPTRVIMPTAIINPQTGDSTCDGSEFV
jgi:hypothetical protein